MLSDLKTNLYEKTKHSLNIASQRKNHNIKLFFGCIVPITKIINACLNFPKEDMRSAVFVECAKHALCSRMLCFHVDDVAMNGHAFSVADILLLERVYKNRFSIHFFGQDKEKVDDVLVEKLIELGDKLNALSKQNAHKVFCLGGLLSSKSVVKISIENLMHIVESELEKFPRYGIEWDLPEKCEDETIGNIATSDLQTLFPDDFQRYNVSEREKLEQAIVGYKATQPGDVVTEVHSQPQSMYLYRMTLKGLERKLEKVNALVKSDPDKIRRGALIGGDCKQGHGLHIHIDIGVFGNNCLALVQFLSCVWNVSGLLGDLSRVIRTNLDYIPKLSPTEIRKLQEYFKNHPNISTPNQLVFEDLRKILPDKNTPINLQHDKYKTLELRFFQSVRSPEDIVTVLRFVHKMVLGAYRNSYKKGFTLNPIESTWENFYGLLYEVCKDDRELFQKMERIFVKRPIIGMPTVTTNPDSIGCALEQAIKVNNSCLVRQIIRKLTVSLKDGVLDFTAIEGLHPVNYAQVMSKEKALMAMQEELEKIYQEAQQGANYKLCKAVKQFKLAAEKECNTGNMLKANMFLRELDIQISLYAGKEDEARSMKLCNFQNAIKSDCMETFVHCFSTVLPVLSELVGSNELNMLSKNGLFVKYVLCNATNRKYVLYICDYFGMSRDELSDIFLIAVQVGNVDAVNDLLAKGVDVNATLRSSGETALRLAIRGVHVEVVKALLDSKNVNINVMTDDCGRSDLYVAAVDVGDTDIVRALLERGANMDLKDGVTGVTVFYRVVERGNFEMVQVFLKANANVRETNYLGNTMLHVAADNNDTRLIKVFVRNNLLSVDELNGHKQTPLHVAAARGHVNTIMALLDCGSDVNAKDLTGSTPLCEAICNSSINNPVVVLKAFLAKGVCLSEKFHYDCSTVLHLVARIGNEDMINALLKAGAPLNVANKFGYTPLHEAAEYGTVEAVTALCVGGADVTAENRWGQTALMIAIARGEQELITELEKYKICKIV